ncbi:ATP-dependent helicase [Aquincola sp. S2]|uniref:ATP-dependent helicase n=1 Tax=Pseudaquabacterium terrae TaxID=2732868 RepID=A0ABX2EFL8_9BURK|nr:ATP-dependent helicase [Aquabacterium terrae]NRF67393.1 ATP-dependent helicase [Aquabacterium terrae]
MAIFIPEWSKLSGRDVHLKRVLGALDDQHVIRRPVRLGCPADLFVQHLAGGWLAIAVSTLEFSTLAHAQLFAQDERTRFEWRLEQLQQLMSRPDGAAAGSAVLVVMWACSSEEVRVLAPEYFRRYGAHLVSREQVAQPGAEQVVQDLLAPLPEHAEHGLLAAWFPEAEIPAVCTTRRFLQRDNSARLTRCFLDHEQEWASKLDLELPQEQHAAAADFSVRLLNGVAGSGKTLIAINRALLLAELFPRQRILVLIHNTPIVADLNERLYQVRGGLPGNVEMLTVFAWICRQWRHVFGALPKMPDRRAVDELVQHQRLRWPELKPSTAQLIAELDFINNALIPDGQAYLASSRTGRRFALAAEERTQVWALYQAVTSTLRCAGQHMWSALPRTICLAHERHHALERYHHILADEAQFFAPSWFDVVKLSLAAHGQLFLCADPKQGFLKNRQSWKSAGIEVAGRTKKLRRSYRTTSAILEAATTVMAVLGPADGDDSVEPDYAGMVPGKRPLLACADTPQDAIDRLCNELAGAHARGLPLGAFLVIYGEQVNRRTLHACLERRVGAGKVWWFNEQRQKRAPPHGRGRDYLRLAYLDTATGLEACIVFLIGVENLFFSGRVAGLGDEERAERREENARRLYMAMTRAGQRLILVSAQRLPPQVEALFDSQPDERNGS